MSIFHQGPAAQRDHTQATQASQSSLSVTLSGVLRVTLEMPVMCALAWTVSMGCVLVVIMTSRAPVTQALLTQDARQLSAALIQRTPVKVLTVHARKNFVQYMHARQAFHARSNF